jgi:hypothetical protein
MLIGSLKTKLAAGRNCDTGVSQTRPLALSLIDKLSVKRLVQYYL